MTNIFCFYFFPVSFEEIKIIKFLFGLPYDSPVEDEAAIIEEKLKEVNDMIALLDQMISGIDSSTSSDNKTIFYQVLLHIYFILKQPEGPYHPKLLCAGQGICVTVVAKTAETIIFTN